MSPSVATWLQASSPRNFSLFSFADTSCIHGFVFYCKHFMHHRIKLSQDYPAGKHSAEFGECVQGPGDKRWQRKGYLGLAL